MVFSDCDHDGGCACCEGEALGLWEGIECVRGVCGGPNDLLE